ncbi:hypothetical protein DICPUDRAFT_155735 [Dictyostelium purpureum]|uniref:Transglutaminase-like domain-containing protein n=1 Tax=Dictyostelium purpureum TaxID=5786 RepID=F0ZUR4_DICPU|nr:uncharacterized protein DICPUDRAFT_155735 [Dictyostelium purpureum]EGC32321.1 hypothetical protein DICPUDRAFT_155735 [Dictyostelium purpureum]|eukprot:XP_003291163.1 hypothetical protein DICPUDRAFT_155735 [Dictyostelium purpureum]
MKTIVVIYNDKEYPVEIESDTTYEELTFQVFSLTDVEPDDQLFYNLYNTSTPPLPNQKLNVLNNQKVFLQNFKNKSQLFNSSNSFIDPSLRNRIESFYRGMIKYNDERLQYLALEQIPIEIKKEQSQMKKVQMLLDWFKNNYFCWVNAPECIDLKCGTPNTKLVGHEQPTIEEMKHQASRVEVYRCDSGHITRFPRYNSVEKLLETKSGRCGEWANTFTLYLMAVGVNTRYIFDFTDHVWNEAFIDGRWVHLDSCEAAYDTPLVYEGGWGKKNLSYIFAFELDGVYDVTKRYTIRFNQLNRSLANEQALVSYLYQFNHKIRSTLPHDLLRDLLKRETSELLETETFASRNYGDNLTGRVSGSLDWRTSRGESGDGDLTIGPGNNSSNNNNQLPVPTINKTIYILDSISKAKESLNLVGNCSITKNGIQITANETDKIGAFWLKEKIDVISNGGFICKLKFLIKKDGDGADGMAFVIQNNSINSMGIGGYGLGYHSIPNSVAIEFDTYPSKDHARDPDGNHISVNTRGREPNSAHHRFSIACGNPKNNKPMNDGVEHECFIKYSSSEKTLDVWLDNYQVLNKVSIDIQSLLNLDSNKAFLGMTASTGGLKQAHIISSFSIGN